MTTSTTWLAFLHWFIGAAWSHLLNGIKAHQIDAEFPRRHTYRTRFWRLMHSIDMRPYDVIGIRGRVVTVGMYGDEPID